MATECSASPRLRSFPFLLALTLTVSAVLAWPDSDESAAVAAIPTDTAVVTLSSSALIRAAELTVPADEVPAVEIVAFDPVVEEPVRQHADLLHLLKVGLGERAEPSLQKFGAAYRSLRRLAALGDVSRLQQGGGITGVASTYNPFREGASEGGVSTASGENYDPQGWTAAIQIDLRTQFGGVRFGRLYRPAYALIECGEKQAIVKINDVGPLRPGRVIDLNERSMRYFDPFLRRGLLSDVRVTLLPGEDWTPGPIGGAEVVRYAGNL